MPAALSLDNTQQLKATPQQREPSPLSVSQLNAAVRAYLEYNFPRIWVVGELAEINLHPSGHVYFTLKDPMTGAQVRGVAFRYLKKAQADGLAKGMAVQVYGTVSIFEQNGAYQIYATAITPHGQGELDRKLQELKARLAAEGLFDPTRKRPIPRMPRTIGLVTAPTGAAIQDFLKNVKSPYGGPDVKFIPAAVQGNDAVRQITAAINYLDQHDQCEVIVVTRGGGGQEDLVAFNDEILVRAVAAARIPVLSAVGHDRDLSLCDLAADRAVSTPTAAANLLVRERIDLCNRLDQATERARQAVLRTFTACQQRCQRAQACTYLNRPMDWLNRLTERQDYATARLNAALPNLAVRQRTRLDAAGLRLERLQNAIPAAPKANVQNLHTRLNALTQNLLLPAQNRLRQAQSFLTALNPKAVLTRGYAILMTEDGHAVRKPDDARPGDNLDAILAQGHVKLQVMPTINTPTQP